MYTKTLRASASISSKAGASSSASSSRYSPVIRSRSARTCAVGRSISSPFWSAAMYSFTAPSGMSGSDAHVP
jgi:hypothetical protein